MILQCVSVESRYSYNTTSSSTVEARSMVQANYLYTETSKPLVESTDLLVILEINCVIVQVTVNPGMGNSNTKRAFVQCIFVTIRVVLVKVNRLHCTTSRCVVGLDVAAVIITVINVSLTIDKVDRECKGLQTHIKIRLIQCLPQPY